MLFGLACATGELRSTALGGAAQRDAERDSGDSGAVHPNDVGPCPGWRGETELAQAGVRVVGDGDRTWFGDRIVGAENFAGDGRHAFAIEDPWYGNSTGAAYLLTAEHGDLASAADLPRIEALSDGDGVSLGAAGDFDGDGLGDFLIAPGPDSDSSIELIFGPDFVADTLVPDLGGYFIRAHGGQDLDLDGADDICISRADLALDTWEVRCLAGGSRSQGVAFDDGILVVSGGRPDWPGSGLIGDFDLDWSPDYALADEYGETVRVFSDPVGSAGEWEDADITLREDDDYYYGSQGFGHGLFLGDVDGDGERSLISVSSGSVYMGSHVTAFELPLPDGTWAAMTVPQTDLPGPSSAFYGSAVVVDPERDGTDEVVVGWFDWYGGPDGVAVLDDSHDGVAAVRAADGADVEGVDAGDLDGDGCPELAIGSRSAGGESVVYVVE